MSHLDALNQQREHQRLARYAGIRKQKAAIRTDASRCTWQRLRLRSILLKHPDLHVKEWESEVEWEEDDVTTWMWFAALVWVKDGKWRLPVYIDLKPSRMTGRTVTAFRRKLRWARETHHRLHIMSINDLTEGRLRVFIMRVKQGAKVVGE